MTSTDGDEAAPAPLVRQPARVAEPVTYRVARWAAAVLVGLLLAGAVIALVTTGATTWWVGVVSDYLDRVGSLW